MGLSQKEATELAAELAAKLEKHYGVFWKQTIWENLGWHYSVSHRFLTVYPSSEEGKFYALLGEYGGRPLWSDNFTACNPICVIDHQLELARQAIAGLQYMLDKSTPKERNWH